MATTTTAYRPCALGAALAAVLVTTLGGAGSQSVGPWSTELAKLNGTEAEYESFIRPIANSTYLSYTATFGAYYNPADANRSIPGWSKQRLEANPAGGGMRALLFTQPDTGRALVAFRGTDLDISSVSGQADSCADALIAGGTDAQLPGYCRRFGAGTLDYITNAVGFALQVEALCELLGPSVQIMFTGHSLGATLAVMAAARVAGSVAVVFAPPPATDLLWSRFGLTSAEAAAAGSFVFMGNEFDPVYHQAVGQKGVFDNLCVWAEHDPVPVTCAACFKGHPAFLDLANVACGACFGKEHIFGHYFFDLIPTQPRCGAAAAAAFPRPHIGVRMGKAPTLDGKLDPAEWSDATSLLTLAPPTVPQFSAVVSAADLSWAQAWVKYDQTHLFFGFQIRDDVAYGTDTPYWAPAGNPDAGLLNKTGWPWFGDEMEILVNAQPSRAPAGVIAGNASQWQMCVNTAKSRLGGFGVPGLIEAEPRASPTAWPIYRQWIESKVMEAAVHVLRPPEQGAPGWSVEWAVGYKALETAPGVPFDPAAATADTPIGINIAVGDVDTREVGDTVYGFHHENWVAGQKNLRTRLEQFATLWLLH